MASMDGPCTLEYWLSESVYNANLTSSRIAELAAILEPVRADIEAGLERYEPDEQSWHDYRDALWAWVPKDLEDQVSAHIAAWYGSDAEDKASEVAIESDAEEARRRIVGFLKGAAKQRLRSPSLVNLRLADALVTAAEHLQAAAAPTEQGARKGNWTRVVLESPLQGGTERELDNVRYLDRCIADSLRRGEAPFASHGLYPRALDDRDPTERALGMAAGFVWRDVAAATVVYVDRGVTQGMQAGIEHSLAVGCPVIYRMLDGNNVG